MKKVYHYFIKNSNIDLRNKFCLLKKHKMAVRHKTGSFHHRVYSTFFANINGPNQFLKYCHTIMNRLSRARLLF